MALPVVDASVLGKHAGGISRVDTHDQSPPFKSKLNIVSGILVFDGTLKYSYQRAFATRRKYTVHTATIVVLSWFPICWLIESLATPNLLDFGLLKHP